MGDFLRTRRRRGRGANAMITLEKLTASHQEAWAGLWAQYLAFYETTRDQDIFDLTFARLIDDTHDCEAYIAFAGVMPLRMRRESCIAFIICISGKKKKSVIYKIYSLPRLTANMGWHKNSSHKSIPPPMPRRERRLLADPRFQRNRPPIIRQDWHKNAFHKIRPQMTQFTIGRRAIFA